MKKYFYCLTLAGIAFFSTNAISQNMVVVNNTPGIKADYKTLQGALDSVTDGTLILLQPGPVTYGSVSVKKRISIIGGGYFLNQNPEPTRQATPVESKVSVINFDSASTGSYITGLSLTGEINGGNNRVNFNTTSNITISRCLLYPGSNGWFVSFYKSSLVKFKQCFFRTPPGFGNANIMSSRESNGMEFHNSIFEMLDLAYSHILPSEYFTNYNTSVLFMNNVMYNVSNPGFYPSAVTMVNNIIFQRPGYSAVNIVAGSNNVGNATYSAAGTNITNAVEANTLVLNSDPTISSGDARYKLRAGSAAIGYGQGGVDCGAFGGNAADSYELSGIAEFVPNIFFMNVPTVGTTTGGLPVRIKVRANQ